MSFWQTAAKAARLAREYGEATDAALRAVEQGQSIDEIVKAFAAETDNELDDEAANILIAGLDKTAAVLEKAVALATEWSPQIAEWGVKALVWKDKLNRLRTGRP